MVLWFLWHRIHFLNFDMENSLEEYRPTIGCFNCKKSCPPPPCESPEDPDLGQDPTSVIIIGRSTTIHVGWKTAVTILITTLSWWTITAMPLCSWGVELNPGPCSGDIIAALSAGPPSDDIRNCIRMYEPNKTMTKIKKALNKAPIGGNNDISWGPRPRGLCPTSCHQQLHLPHWEPFARPLSCVLWHICDLQSWNITTELIYLWIKGPQSLSPWSAGYSPG